MHHIVELTASHQLYEALPDAMFPRFEIPAGLRAGDEFRMWALDGAIAAARSGRRVVALGDPSAAARLVGVAMEAFATPPTRFTLPRDAHRLLPDSLPFGELAHWDFRWTHDFPRRVPHGDRVAEQRDIDEELTSFLVEHSPRHSLTPGSPGIVRWAGIRDEDTGRLVACGAQHLTHGLGTARARPGIAGAPSLASIATATDQRGRGFGQALTAWLTRTAISETGVCTLGQYADNAVATRLYDRLGYHRGEHYTSGWFVATGSGQARS